MSTRTWNPVAHWHGKNVFISIANIFMFNGQKNVFAFIYRDLIFLKIPKHNYAYVVTLRDMYIFLLNNIIYLN